MKTFSILIFRYLKNNTGAILIIGTTQVAKAYTGACSADNGTYNYYDNFGMLTVVDPKGNQPGYLFPRAYNWNLGGEYTATCDCDPAEEKKQLLTQIYIIKHLALFQ